MNKQKPTNFLSSRSTNELIDRVPNSRRATKMRDDDGLDEGATSRVARSGADGRGANSEVAGAVQDGVHADAGPRRKKRKRRKSKNKQLQLQQLHQLQQQQQQHQQRASTGTHVVVNFPTSCDELEPAAECSKSRDSTSSLGGPSSRHSTLRESLLTVLGKLVVWKGNRYRPTPTSSSSAPPNSPPATECIGRSTVFFSSGEFFLNLPNGNLVIIAHSTVAIVSLLLLLKSIFDPLEPPTELSSRLDPLRQGWLPHLQYTNNNN